MRFAKLHPWNLSAKEAVVIQKRLAPRVIRTGSAGRFRLVAGADAAFSPDGSECIAGVVVWDRKSNSIVEQVVIRTPVVFPYVPGLLSFREAPALLAAFRRLKSDPDVFVFDAQGYAHPRRLGLASHVGLWLDRPSVGCAKSLLVGEFEPPAPQAGSISRLRAGGEVIGMVLRTRTSVKPVFVSVGHRLSLTAAIRVITQCCRGYRLPEPTRLADALVGRERMITGRA